MHDHDGPSAPEKLLVNNHPAVRRPGGFPTPPGKDVAVEHEPCRATVTVPPAPGKTTVARPSRPVSRPERVHGHRRQVENIDDVPATWVWEGLSPSEIRDEG